MNIHFFLKHKLILFLIIILISAFGSCFTSGILLFFVDKNPAATSAVGTWAFGIITATLGLCYFLIDRSRDIEVLFSPVVRPIDNEIMTNSSGSFFCLQAYNNSKMGTVAVPQRIYISYKVPNYDEIRRHYQDRSNSKLVFMEIDELKSIKKIKQSHYQNYFSLPPYSITPEILIETDDLIKSISNHAKYAYHKSGSTPQFKMCWISIVFSNVDSNDPYIFDFPMGKEYTEDINKLLH